MVSFQQRRYDSLRKKCQFLTGISSDQIYVVRSQPFYKILIIETDGKNTTKNIYSGITKNMPNNLHKSYHHKSYHKSHPLCLRLLHLEY